MRDYLTRNAPLLGVLVAILALILLLGTGLAFEYGQTRDAINGSQHQWCAALTLLIAPQTGVQAPNPKTMPNSYRLREDFLLLRKEFRCG